MGALHATVHVAEDVALDEHVHVNDAGEPKGWLYLGESRDVALWGSPAGLRRLAAALVLLAEGADGRGVLRYAATARRDGVVGRVELREVRGS